MNTMKAENLDVSIAPVPADQVKIEVKKVGDKKQLVFNGHAEGKPVSMDEPVGAGAGASSGGGGDVGGPETATS